MIGGGTSLLDSGHGPDGVKLTVFLVVGILIGVALSSLGDSLSSLMSAASRAGEQGEGPARRGVEEQVADEFRPLRRLNAQGFHLALNFCRPTRVGFLLRELPKSLPLILDALLLPDDV